MFVNLVFPHIINACVLTSAFSAGNSSLFTSSRILYGLALHGQAPRIFTYCTKKGLPIVAVLVSVSVPRATTMMTTQHWYAVLFCTLVIHEHFKWLCDRI